MFETRRHFEKDLDMALLAIQLYSMWALLGTNNNVALLEIHTDVALLKNLTFCAGLWLTAVRLYVLFTRDNALKGLGDLIGLELTAQLKQWNNNK